MLLKRINHDPRKVLVHAKGNSCTFIIAPIGEDIAINYHDNEIFVNILHTTEIAINPKNETIEMLWIRGGEYTTYVNDNKICIEVDSAGDVCTLTYGINKDNNEVDMLVDIRLKNEQQIQTKLVLDISDKE